MWSLKGVDWQKDGRGFVVKQKEKAPSGNMCIISDVNPVLLGNQIMCWGVGFLTEKLEVCDLSPAALQLLKGGSFFHYSNGLCETSYWHISNLFKRPKWLCGLFFDKNSIHC